MFWEKAVEVPKQPLGLLLEERGPALAASLSLN